MALSPDLFESCRQSGDGKIGFFHVVIHVNEFRVLMKKEESENDQAIGEDFVVDDTCCELFRQVE